MNYKVIVSKNLLTSTLKGGSACTFAISRSTGLYHIANILEVLQDYTGELIQAELDVITVDILKYLKTGEKGYIQLYLSTDLVVNIHWR